MRILLMFAAWAAAGFSLNAAEPEITFPSRELVLYQFPGTFRTPMRHLLILNSDGEARSQRFAEALAAQLRASGEFRQITVAAPGWIQGENDLPVDLPVLVSATAAEGRIAVDIASRPQWHTMSLPGQAGSRGGSLYARTAVADAGAEEAMVAMTARDIRHSLAAPPVLPEELVDLLTPEFSGPERFEWPEELAIEPVYSAAGPGRSSESLYRVHCTPEEYTAIFEAAQKHFARHADPGLVLISESSGQGQRVDRNQPDWRYLRLARPVDTDQLLLDELARRRLEGKFMSALKGVYPREKFKALYDAADDEFLAVMDKTALLEVLRHDFSPRLLRIAWLRRDEFDSDDGAMFLRLAEEHGVALPEAEIAEFLGPKLDAGSDPVEFILSDDHPDVRWHRRDGAAVVIGAASWWSRQRDSIVHVAEISRTPDDNPMAYLTADTPETVLRHWAAAAEFDDDGLRLTVRPRRDGEAVTAYVLGSSIQPEFERGSGSALDVSANFFPPVRNILVLTADDSEWTRLIADFCVQRLRRNRPELAVTAALPGWIQPPGAAAPDLVLVVGTPLEEAPTPEGFLTRIVLETNTKIFHPGVPGRTEPRGGYWRTQPVRYLNAAKFSAAEREEAARQVSDHLVNSINFPFGDRLTPELADLVIPEFSGPELIDWPEELPFQHLYSAAAPGSSSENVYRLAADPERFETLAEEARMVFYARPDNDGLILAADELFHAYGHSGGDLPLHLRLNRPAERKEALFAALAERGLTAQYLSPLLKAMTQEQQRQLLFDRKFLDAAGVGDLIDGVYAADGGLQPGLLRYLWSRRHEAGGFARCQMVNAARILGIPLPGDEVAEALGPEAAAGAEPLQIVLSHAQPAARWHIQDDRILIGTEARFTGNSVILTFSNIVSSNEIVLTTDTGVLAMNGCRIQAVFETGAVRLTIIPGKE